MIYAVSLAGLTTVKVRNDFVLKMLLADVLDMSSPIDCQSGKFAGVAVPLNCDEERAAAIVTVIRQHYRHDELPIYCSKTGNGGWRYVRGDPRTDASG